MASIFPFVRNFLIINSLNSPQSFDEANQKTCMEKLIEMHFQGSNSFLFVSENNCVNTPTTLPVIITNFNLEQTKTNFYSTSAIMVSKTYKSFTKQIESYRNSRLWNEKNTPKGKMIIFFQSNEDIKQIFTYLWKIYILKVIVVKNTKLYTSFPFTIESNCTQTAHLELLGTCERIKTFRFPKFPKYLHDCTMRAAIFGKHIGLPYINPTNVSTTKAGVLIEPLKLLNWKYGLNIVYDVQNDEMQDLKPKIGSVGFKDFVYNGSMDLLVASPYLMPGIFSVFDASDVIFYDKHNWLLRNPKPISKNLTFTIVFAPATWIVLIITVIATAFFYWKISLVQNEQMSFSAAIFVVYCFTIGCNFKISASKALRVLFLFYFFYSLHIVNVFQGRLNSILMKSVYQKRITNSVELAESKLNIFFIYLINYNLVKVYDDSLMMKLASKSILLENITNPVDWLMGQDDYVTSLFENSIYLTDAHKLQVNW